MKVEHGLSFCGDMVQILLNINQEPPSPAKLSSHGPLNRAVAATTQPLQESQAAAWGPGRRGQSTVPDAISPVSADKSSSHDSTNQAVSEASRTSQEPQVGSGDCRRQSQSTVPDDNRSSSDDKLPFRDPSNQAVAGTSQPLQEPQAAAMDSGWLDQSPGALLHHPGRSRRGTPTTEWTRRPARAIWHKIGGGRSTQTASRPTLGDGLRARRGRRLGYESIEARGQGEEEYKKSM